MSIFNQPLLLCFLLAVLGLSGLKAQGSPAFGVFAGVYEVQSCRLTVNGHPYEGDSLCDRAKEIEMRDLGEGRFEIHYHLAGEPSQQEVLSELRRQGENFVEQARFVEEDLSVYWFRQYREFPEIYALDEWREWMGGDSNSTLELQFVRFQRELRGNDVKSLRYNYYLKPKEAPSRKL